MIAVPNTVTTDHDLELARLLVVLTSLRLQAIALKRGATLLDEEERDRRLALIKGEQERLHRRVSALVIQHGATIPGLAFEHDGERVLSIAPIQRSLL